VELVVRALRSLGKKVRFIYSWDDYDVFRKVPENMPRREELEQYLRLPITFVPDPLGRDSSYARHNEADVENMLPLVGIQPEYLYQTERYRASLYAGGIRKALLKRAELQAILDKFRDEEHKIQGEWTPVSVFCDKCNRDDTLIIGFDGDWKLAYHCNACGHNETVDLRQAKSVKLLWRVDWPMRWAFEGVDFEPAGKDHHSQGGSFDTARLISKEVYGFEAPVTFRYDFIGIKGAAGKMSSSRGNVISLETLLQVYTPELVRYLFAGTRPNTEFTISFDLDVIKIYEDYDRTERIAYRSEPVKNEETYLRERRIYELSQVDRMEERMPYQASFRHLCNLLQIAGGDIDKTLAGLPGLAPEQAARLKTRCRCALNWLELYAPEEFCFKLRGPGLPPPSGLSDVELAAVRSLRDMVVYGLDSFKDDKTCAEAIYKAAAAAGAEPKALFRAAYQALTGKDQGPRLASFLRIIGKERLSGILAAF